MCEMQSVRALEACVGIGVYVNLRFISYICIYIAL